MRTVVVVTTGAPPWRTGTAVNPTIRAAHLAHTGFDVCLVLPWLADAKDQRIMYHGHVFATRAKQAAYVREWIAENTDFQYTGRIAFYDAVYECGIGCILQEPHTDIIRAIPDEYRDIAVLEEPDHLNWMHDGTSWIDAFVYVVGISHTNYCDYASKHAKHSVGWKLKMVSSWADIIRSAYTDVNIHLSAATLTIPDTHSYVVNVNGVRPRFFRPSEGQADGVYFIGKALWNKGYDLMIELCAELGIDMPPVHAYGSGPDFDAIRAAVHARSLGITLHDGVDHSPASVAQYRTFFNPSKSEVLCTATAEALAMGKYAILPIHPSNEFFYVFSNCLVYGNVDELAEAFRRVQAVPPAPLSAWESRRLSWNEATDRLIGFLGFRTNEKTRRVLLRAGCRGVHKIFMTQPLQAVMRKTMGVSAAPPREHGYDSVIVGSVVFVLLAWASTVRGNDTGFDENKRFVVTSLPKRLHHMARIASLRSTDTR